MQTFQRDFIAILNHQDMKKHIPYLVIVPPGMRVLRVRVSYAPHMVERINNLLTLTILDPDGFRGAAHRHSDVLEVAIQDNAASPGFFPGAIQTGEWTVLIDTHMIMPGEPLQLELVVSGADEIDPDLRPGPVAAPMAGRPQRGPGWYRGDLHAHSIHSDGDWDIPDLVTFAQANRLDFITLSDHNTVTGLDQFERTCPDGLLPICGTELTTFWGHALALGRRAWADWRIEPGTREMNRIAAEIEEQGGLFIIAHPEAIGDPYCTGCHWSFQDMRPGPARVVEVWNSPWNSESNNEAGLDLAYEWMRRGLRMVLTAGTDRHGKPYAAPAAGFNVVYADDLSEGAVLRAIRAGHLYLSSGPTLALTAQAGGQTLMLGDACRAATGETIHLSAKWDGCPSDGRIELIVDGVRCPLPAAGAPGSASFELPGGQTGWALLSVRSLNDDILALTNPIYFDGR